MELVKNEEEIFRNISIVKKKPDQYITNFYFMDYKLKDLISKQKLYKINRVNNIFFLIINDGFYNLHFCSRNKSFLRKSLAEDLKNIKSPLVIDLIGKEKMIKELKEIFIENNFDYYTTFIRMSKINNNNAILRADNDILFAKPEDTFEIYNIISTNFNKYSEHLPSQEEINNVINKYNILIKKEKNKIVALLFFDKIGYSSTLRYWYVDKKFRGLKLGAELIKRYFYECRSIKRLILWVELANIKVIKIYKYYGYKYDDLTDYIMIKVAKINERYKRNFKRDKA